MAIGLCIGAAPAAFAGAWAVSVFNRLLLEICLGLLTFFSGLNSLRTQKFAEALDAKVSNRMLLTVGGVTGFLSSLTGTGGPLVLVPIMMSMSVPVLTAVGLSQAIQLPVAIAATLGNVLYGKLDLTLGGDPCREFDGRIVVWRQACPCGTADPIAPNCVGRSFADWCLHPHRCRLAACRVTRPDGTCGFSPDR